MRVGSCYRQAITAVCEQYGQWAHDADHAERNVAAELRVAQQEQEKPVTAKPMEVLLSLTHKKFKKGKKVHNS